MNKITSLYRDSFLELKKVRTITAAAMLMAVSCALGAFTLNLGPYLKIGFSSLVNELACYLFGPVVGAIYGAVLDVIKYFIAPSGPFFPGFTLDAAVAGLIYGTALYRKELTFKRVFITQFFVSLICNVLMNTFWISVLYGKGFLALLPARNASVFSRSFCFWVSYPTRSSSFMWTMFVMGTMAGVSPPSGCTIRNALCRPNFPHPNSR